MPVRHCASAALCQTWPKNKFLRRNRCTHEHQLKRCCCCCPQLHWCALRTACTLCPANWCFRQCHQWRKHTSTAAPVLPLTSPIWLQRAAPPVELGEQAAPGAARVCHQRDGGHAVGQELVGVDHLGRCWRGIESSSSRSSGKTISKADAMCWRQTWRLVHLVRLHHRQLK